MPSDDEWQVLVDFAGCEKVAGNILKASVGWAEDGNGIDVAGFSALPGGHGSSDGGFYYVGEDGFWWSATEYNASSAYDRYMGYNRADVGRNDYDKAYLFSVRCVQD